MLSGLSMAFTVQKGCIKLSKNFKHGKAHKKNKYGKIWIGSPYDNNSSDRKMPICSLHTEKLQYI